MIFHRRKWQEKPIQWGAFSAVRAALRDNLERIGIDYADVVLALPMWGPGDQQDYGRYGLHAANTGGSFERNRIHLDDAQYLTIPNHDAIDFEAGYAGDWTLFFDWRLNNLINSYARILCKSSSDGTDGMQISVLSGVPQVIYERANSQRRYILSIDFPDVFSSWCITYEHEAVISDRVLIYENGSSKSVSDASGSYGWGNTYNWQINGRPGNASNYSDFEIDGLLFFHKKLSADQIAALEAAKNQIWQPVARPTYSIPSGDTILPILCTIGATVDGATSDFSGKIGVGGGLIASSEAATLENQGQEGKQGDFNFQASPLIGLLSGGVGNSGDFSSILSQSAMILAGALGNQGPLTGQVSLSAQIFGSVNDGTPQIIVEGTLSAVAEALEADLLGQTGQQGTLTSQVIAAASLAGQLGASGSYTMQLDGVSSIIEAALGVSGEITTTVSAGTNISGKIGVAGEVIAALDDLGLQLIEIVKSERIYQILLSTKTGQVIFLAPKTATINIVTST